MVDAGGKLKERVEKEIVEKRAEEVSEEDLRQSKYNGIMFSISSGARTDGYINIDSPIFFSLPINRSEELISFMQENGVDVNNQHVQQASIDGFIGIVEAIKNDKGKNTPEGFEHLDWYFDTFKYQEHMDEFIDEIDFYQEQADKAFGAKLSEYLSHREEFKKWQEQQLPKQDETILALSKAENVTAGDLLDFLQDNMDNGGELSVFPKTDIRESGNQEIVSEYHKTSKHPTSIEKCTKAKEEIEKIRELDPDASFYLGKVFEQSSSNKEPLEYALVRFGKNGFNNVIAIHIGDSSKAMFCWRGKTGDDAEGWREHFQNTSIRNRSDAVKRFICWGYSEKGFVSLSDQWARIWEYLDSPDQESATA